MILNKNISPETLKSLSEKELRKLCSEIRQFLINTVSKTGGHLASNLGTVELTVALHKVFSSPDDKFVFDVGHQSYTHKLLTGRYGEFSSLRKKGGISGFPKQSESKHDAFIGGHSGISVSAALGVAESMRLSELPHKTIAIAGDGSFTDGGIYEGLNNVGKSTANLLVILNDNGMSISKNTGAIATYLSHLRSSRGYYTAKKKVKSFLEQSKAGNAVSHAVSATKKVVRKAVYPPNLFENLGFKYYGIVDGHNLTDLIDVFEVAKMLNQPCFIHVKTKKGKGFKPAERNSGEYHGVDANCNCAVPAPVNKKTSGSSKPTYSKAFGKAIVELAKKDDRIVLITAAMKYATGCNYFKDEYPERFYDCGIAEAHAVTFAAGLASSKNILPVFAVYSTFLQRGFDRMLHDCAIENQHVVFAVDRAGAVGEDGETHQGLFDVAMMSAIPNFTIYSPSNTGELRQCLANALYMDEGPVAVRYPRGTAENGEYNGSFVFNNIGGSKLVVSYGRLYKEASGLGSSSLKLVKIKPLPEEAINIIMRYNEVIFYEEGIERGGIGEALLLELTRRGFKNKYSVKAVNGFVTISDVQSQLDNIINGSQT